VPPPLPISEPYREVPRAVPVPGRWVRGTLLGLALGIVAVFGTAAWLNPYEADGRPRRMETHLQIGLPPCSFRLMTGVPCPSCGVTTSFALLVRGDIANSLRANAVGTALALFCAALVPWALACAVCRRYFLIRSLERALTAVVVVFVVLLVLRWLFVLGLAWWSGTRF
jgi:hypothetical protein